MRWGARAPPPARRPKLVRRDPPPCLYAAALAAGLAIATPAVAQTVILPDPPPARGDSARSPAPGGPAARPDTTRRDTTRPAPAPYGITPAPTPPARPAGPAPPPALPAAVAPADDQLPRGICADAVPGEAAPDVLRIVFEGDATPEARDAAIASVSGKRLGGGADDEVQYVNAPAGGSEFRLRTLADKLIRLSGISEVGPVTCPAQPAQPAQPPKPAQGDTAGARQA